MIKHIRFFLIGFLIVLSGCQQQWYFNIEEIQDPAHPVFCISLLPDCEGQGLNEYLLYIDEINERGTHIKKMWGINAISNVKLKKVSYGAVPDGYKELLPATPLEIGKLYTLNDHFFFRLSKEGSVIKTETYNGREFHEKFKPKYDQ